MHPLCRQAVLASVSPSSRRALACRLADRQLERRQLVVVDDRPGVRRGVAAQVEGHDQAGHLRAAHVDRDLVVFDHVAVEVGQGDRALGALVGRLRVEARAGEDPVGHRGAARHVAHAALAAVDRRVGAGDAAAGHGQRLHEARQVGPARVVARHDAGEGVVLAGQGRAADEVALEGREAHRQLGQRDGEDRDLGAVVVGAELEAVERQAGLEAQRVARAQAGRRGPAGQQGVPQPRRGRRLDEELEAERLAGVAGASDPHARPGRRAARRSSLRSGSGSRPAAIDAREDVARAPGPAGRSWRSRGWRRAARARRSRPPRGRSAPSP